MEFRERLLANAMKSKLPPAASSGTSPLAEEPMIHALTEMDVDDTEGTSDGPEPLVTFPEEEEAADVEGKIDVPPAPILAILPPPPQVRKQIVAGLPAASSDLNVHLRKRKSPLPRKGGDSEGPSKKKAKGPAQSTPLPEKKAKIHQVMIDESKNLFRSTAQCVDLVSKIKDPENGPIRFETLHAPKAYSDFAQCSMRLVSLFNKSVYECEEEIYKAGRKESNAKHEQDRLREKLDASTLEYEERLMKLGREVADAKEEANSNAARVARLTNTKDELESRVKVLEDKLAEKDAAFKAKNKRAWREGFKSAMDRSRAREDKALSLIDRLVSNRDSEACYVMGACNSEVIAIFDRNVPKEIADERQKNQKLKAKFASFEGSVDRVIAELRECLASSSGSSASASRSCGDVSLDSSAKEVGVEDFAGTNVGAVGLAEMSTEKTAEEGLA